MKCIEFRRQELLEEQRLKKRAALDKQKAKEDELKRIELQKIQLEKQELQKEQEAYKKQHDAFLNEKCIALQAYCMQNPCTFLDTLLQHFNISESDLLFIFDLLKQRNTEYKGVLDLERRCYFYMSPQIKHDLIQMIQSKGCIQETDLAAFLNRVIQPS